MIALQDLLEEREDLQLILMSATMPTRDLAEYWCGVGQKRIRQNEDSSITAADERSMPIEINIPGRTFPVQVFYLEDVLSITGFVSEYGKNATTDMAQIESDLMAALLGGGKNKKAMANQSSSSSMSQPENSLACFMCNRNGFKTAEEFGTHVALCDGGGNVSMLELEDRVKSVDVSSVSGFDSAAAAALNDDDVGGDDESCLDVIMEDDDMEDYYDDEEEECGLVEGKWDGQSPFGTDAAAPSNKTSLTEEEMLNRYQTMYDDEEINYDLTLDLVRYIVKSSYGDGAILIFFSGWGDISEFSLILENTPPFNEQSQFVVYPLHSGIPSKDQRRVFQKPTKGVRKIILATNIAEVS